MLAHAAPPEGLGAQYDATYRGGESAWRRVGAVSKAKNIVRLCESIPHARVLEIGAGEGAVTARLSELGFAHEFTALEISSAAAETIRARRIRGLVDARVYDGEQIPFASGAFDLAILSHVVEHLEHPRKVLYEAARVAAHVFVEVPLEDSFRRRGNYVPNEVGHINFYSPRTIRWLLQSCGFQVLHEKVVNPGREVYAFAKPILGPVDHAAKSALLAVFGPLAPYLTWRFHCAILCKSPRRAGASVAAPA